MRNALLVVFILAIMITSCSTPPSETDIQTAIAATEADSPTATPIPLSDLDLELILLMDGDLPAGYLGAQIRSSRGPGVPEEVSNASNTVFQQFAKDEEPAGGVTVYLFESAPLRDDAFDAIVLGLDNSEITDEVGEKAVAWSIFLPLVGGLGTIEGAEVVFVRCEALVVIEMSGTSQLTDLLPYAQRLDQRLQKLICYE